ncbi:GNAT family N-acetyltransferase [Streptomyces sp. NPDC047315]|uniref:GNAT family N-acetyltransferase n=1 Tax=Streptomyces sp. NPDC047315 TaxID=3155142 RepID=UPI0033C1D935
MIETERLLLRPLRVEDVEDFVTLHSDPRVNRFVGSYTHQRALERLTDVERQWTQRGHGLCAIELRSSGEFIGRTGLNYWENYDEVELGWTLKVAERLGFTPLREDELFGDPVTVFACPRPAGAQSTRSGELAD